MEGWARGLLAKTGVGRVEIDQGSTRPKRAERPANRLTGPLSLQLSVDSVLADIAIDNRAEGVVCDRRYECAALATPKTDARFAITVPTTPTTFTHYPPAHARLPWTPR